jgi:hypothetical protein
VGVAGEDVGWTRGRTRPRWKGPGPGRDLPPIPGLRGSGPARRRAKRVRAPPADGIFSSCPCSPPSVPLARRPQVAGRARPRPSGSWHPSRSSAASPALRSRSLAVRALLSPPVAPSAPPREVPRFGAVSIARSAGVRDRRAGLPADLRSVAEPVAGGKEAVRPRKPACGQAVDRRYVLGCRGDRAESESPTTPPWLSARAWTREGPDQTRGGDSVETVAGSA